MKIVGMSNLDGYFIATIKEDDRYYWARGDVSINKKKAVISNLSVVDEETKNDVDSGGFTEEAERVIQSYFIKKEQKNE